MSKREKLMQAVDALALRIATRKYVLFGPVLSYQNLPWVGITGARRATGTESRYKAMLSYLQERDLWPVTVLDVGCNVGYFSLSFAERGATVYGVDMNPLALRVATIASRKLNDKSGRFIPIQMCCTPQTAIILPQSDVTICLSIWHHWVRYQGLTAATEILHLLWERTNSVLFFDTGENEMPAYYNLPFQGQDAVEWLTGYLKENLPNAEIIRLGRFKAFAPHGHEASANVFRTLFAGERNA